MYHETTLYLSLKTLQQLELAALNTQKRVTQLIRMLLRRVEEDHRECFIHGTPVQYQSDDPRKQWHRLHISFEEDEYEHVTDMRKFFKQSVSKIVSDAIHKHLSTLVYVLRKRIIGDTYRCRNHAVAVRSHGHAVCWIILWGVEFHPEKGKKIPPPCKHPCSIT